ncbi:sulfatase maturation enzyme AslB (radical SAM superfamily) [Methanococcus maripaludis]|uniref:Sulfatase maturation enzyme AslB (Radical SAM superfamily) n=1 Tax=Methanococcus maripaludis TaxID=39152 RepID=A0A7J9NVG3_METMI|nr:radical SAM protein [Methanococcus maripaludis]MBA2851659.1 sulfatase maturation enzyme AslB (radical SAM superfamily) [Methanococcus maripaludis]
MFVLLCLSKSCNLKCEGCSATHTGATLDEKSLETIIATLSKMSNDNRITDIVMHGCETFMVNPVMLDRLITWIRATLPAIKLSCQTNGTLIDDTEVFNVLVNHNVSMSTSYRGTEELFDKVTRVSGSYKKFVSGAEKIKKYMGGKLSAILYYPTELEDEFLDNYKEIIDDAVRIGITNLKINEFESNVPNKRYFEFVTKCTEYIMEKQYSLALSPVTMLMKVFHGNGSLECAWRHNCKTFVAVQLDGTIEGCNRGYKEYKPVYNECLQCEIYGWCSGGCESTRELCGYYPYCEDRKKLVKWVLANRLKLYLYYHVFKQII